MTLFRVGEPRGKDRRVLMIGIGFSFAMVSLGSAIGPVVPERIGELIPYATILAILALWWLLTWALSGQTLAERSHTAQKMSPVRAWGSIALLWGIVAITLYYTPSVGWLVRLGALGISLFPAAVSALVLRRNWFVGVVPILGVGCLLAWFEVDLGTSLQLLFLTAALPLIAVGWLDP